jgi:hypothetical protein
MSTEFASAVVVGASETPRARVRYLAYEGRYLFAWHHARTSATQSEAPRCLCPPLGSDYVVAYRVWRILAERSPALASTCFASTTRAPGTLGRP